MSILIDNRTRALVQGATGAVGSFQCRVMLSYGTRIVGAVTPGKAGEHVHGIPVYEFVEDAVRLHQPNAALSFVPARFVRDAALEVIDAKIPLLVITAEGVPDWDMAAIIGVAGNKGVTVLGPDTPGLISPGKCKLGVHPERMFLEGRVGVLSKSGALSYEVGRILTEHGIGQSTVVGIGGGPIWGMRQATVLGLFEEDPETKAVVLLGEIGGTMEIEAAEFMRDGMTKPVIALIVGRSAPQGVRMGHAGAIIEGSGSTAEGKIEALRGAGALIVKRPSELPAILTRLGI